MIINLFRENKYKEYEIVGMFIDLNNKDFVKNIKISILQNIQYFIFLNIIK